MTLHLTSRRPRLIGPLGIAGASEPHLWPGDSQGSSQPGIRGCEKQAAWAWGAAQLLCSALERQEQASPLKTQAPFASLQGEPPSLQAQVENLRLWGHAACLGAALSIWALWASSARRKRCDPDSHEIHSHFWTMYPGLGMGKTLYQNKMTSNIYL